MNRWVQVTVVAFSIILALRSSFDFLLANLPAGLLLRPCRATGTWIGHTSSAIFASAWAFLPILDSKRERRSIHGPAVLAALFRNDKTCVASGSRRSGPRGQPGNRPASPATGHFRSGSRDP